MSVTDESKFKAETTLKAARLSAAASVVAALLAAGTSYLVIRQTNQIEAARGENAMLQFAAGAPSSHIAYCNILLWKNAGVIPAKLAEPVITAFLNQRKPATGDCSDIK